MTGFGAGMVKYQFIIFSFSFHRFVCGNNLLNDITRCECSSCNMLISPDVTHKKITRGRLEGSHTHSGRYSSVLNDL